MRYVELTTYVGLFFCLAKFDSTNRFGVPDYVICLSSGYDHTLVKVSKMCALNVSFYLNLVECVMHHSLMLWNGPQLTH
jgi:hypothetical protein